MYAAELDGQEPVSGALPLPPSSGLRLSTVPSLLPTSTSSILAAFRGQVVALHPLGTPCFVSFLGFFKRPGGGKELRASLVLSGKLAARRDKTAVCSRFGWGI